MRFLPGVSWLLIITILFLLPSSELPEEAWFEKVYLDKWVHAAFFFVLVWLFYLPLKNGGWLKRTSVLALVYGVIIELLQGFVVIGRSFDSVDILFDGVGCGLAYWWASRQLKK